MTTRILPAAAAGALAAALIVTGCGSASAGHGTPSSVVVPPAATGPGARQPSATLATNRELSRREASALLAATPVPAGAVRLTTVPGAVHRPASRTTATGQADRTRVWRLPLSYARARAWLRAHRPRHLRPDGSMSTGPSLAGTGATSGYAYTGPRSRAWGQAQLAVEVAPAGHGRSYLRADGQVAWLDPVPYPDTAHGRRVRVTLAGGCPASDKGVGGVTNPASPRLRQRLLPAATPTGALECHYTGENGHTFTLARSAHLTPAQARKLASAMNRRQLSHEVGETFYCPLDDASAEIIALAYRSGDIDLWDLTTGCPSVANGFIQTPVAG